MIRRPPRYTLFPYTPLFRYRRRRPQAFGERGFGRVLRALPEHEDRGPWGRGRPQVGPVAALEGEIGRGHVRTPAQAISRRPASSWKKKDTPLYWRSACAF